ncbi:MAG TPA: sugar ABC transporter permease [Thermoanaerobaculia bacterium]|nr:sugar ABC transporter permease [Thermoanaerobaculia bacterium]
MTAETRAAALFLAPALTVILVFFLLPVAAGFVLSLTDFDIYGVADTDNIRFVGFGQYANLARSPVFWQALRNTLVFAIVAGPLTVAVSLGAALLLNAKLAKFKPLFRTIYFAPVVTTLVAVAIVWRYMFHPRFGLLNTVMGWFGIGSIDWLGSPRFALSAIIILAIWKNFGYNMIIFVAGLQSVPEELYEAARIDGAGAWRQFRHITIPMLAPTFVFVGVITAIGYLQLFAEPYVMTPDGGPLNSTLSVVMLMYREGFRWWSMGYAAAIAFVLFVIIMATSLVQLRLRRGAVGS